MLRTGIIAPPLVTRSAEGFWPGKTNTTMAAPIRSTNSVRWIIAVPTPRQFSRHYLTRLDIRWRSGLILDHSSVESQFMSKHAAAAPFKIAALKPRRVCESVAEQIRQAIFSGQLATGHKLPPERDMARQFQTSRVALREALRALEQEGMISIKRGFGGGAFVADFDAALKALADSLHTVVKLGQAKSGHLTEARTILEPELARLAASRADEKDL